MKWVSDRNPNPKLQTLVVGPVVNLNLHTVLSRYYDAHGISKMYRYIQTVVVTVEVLQQCPEPRIFTSHRNKRIYGSNRHHSNERALF
jgi:hypothetical protein